jgi:hypothetical protein
MKIMFKLLTDQMLSALVFSRVIHDQSHNMLPKEL